MYLEKQNLLSYVCVNCYTYVSWLNKTLALCITLIFINIPCYKQFIIFKNRCYSRRSIILHNKRRKSAITYILTKCDYQHISVIDNQICPKILNEKRNTYNFFLTNTFAIRRWKLNYDNTKEVKNMFFFIKIIFNLIKIFKHISLVLVYI